MVLLLSPTTGFRSLDTSPYAGATQAIAWPCSQAMLVTRARTGGRCTAPDVGQPLAREARLLPWGG